MNADNGLVGGELPINRREGEPIGKGGKTMEVQKQTRKPSSRTLKEEDLLKDLERFREKALEFGASAAEVIPASYVVVEERVWLKCLIPRCPALLSGGTPYCPPHTPQPDFMRKAFSQYRWAVLFKKDVEPIEDYIPTSEARRREKPELGLTRIFHIKTHEVVDQLESYAQTEGYDLAMGFGGGTCKSNLCNGTPCGVFENGSCRFPSRARPSMEAVGIDVFDLANKVGWDVYMIRGIEPDLSVIPRATSVGIVFIY